MVCVALVFCLAFIGFTAATQTIFHGYELVSFDVTNSSQAVYLRDLGEEYVELDFWLDPVPDHKSHVLIPPHLVSEVKSRSTSKGLVYQVLNDDIQKLVDASSARTSDEESVRKRATSNYIIDHTNYHSYTQINSYLNSLQSRYPKNVKLSTLNWHTHENRQVTLVQLSSGSGGDKPIILVEAGIHAREWISPAANLYVIEKLVKDYNAHDATAEQMLNNYDWYFVPVNNPDGYEYTRNHYRLWRKNRRPLTNRCTGVDLNRNYDSRFGTTGVSSNKCSDIYPGPSAFSESETSNMRDLVYSLGSRLKSYLSIHSYSQFLIVPWGNVEYVYRPPNGPELDRVAKMMVDALYSPYHTRYTTGTAYQLLNYAAAGAAEDWALGHKPGIYAYCFELRPGAHDSRAFLLPANEIIPQGREYYASLAVLAREMK